MEDGVWHWQRLIIRDCPHDVQQMLEAGKATKVTVILEGVKPSQVTYIRISDFQPKGIRLIQAD